MSQLVEIAHTEPPDQIEVGEWVTLRLIASCPHDAAASVSLPAGGIVCPGVEFNYDLFTRDVELKPGESVSLRVGVRFLSENTTNFNTIHLQLVPIGRPDNERTLIPLPSHALRVVPSLTQAVSVELVRICDYESAVKVELTVRNRSMTNLTDLDIQFQPSDAIHSGPLRRRVSALKSGAADSFEMVLAADTLTLDVSATMNGVRVNSQWTEAIPPSAQSQATNRSRSFVFLEPRSLTRDTLKLVAKNGGREVNPNRNLYPVRGGTSQYILTIYPSDQNATDVDVYTAPGEIEVEPLASTGREWSFQLTVVGNPRLTNVLQLDYDVTTADGVKRGEVYFSIRPNKWSILILAATLGGMLTLKSGIGVLSVLMNSDFAQDELIHTWHELLARPVTELMQLFTIPIFWFVLLFADQLWRPFQEQ